MAEATTAIQWSQKLYVLWVATMQSNSKQRWLLVQGSALNDNIGRSSNAVRLELALVPMANSASTGSDANGSQYQLFLTNVSGWTCNMDAVQ